VPDPTRDVPPEADLPEGPVRYAWFGGLLEGRRGDVDLLRAAVARGNRLGLARFDLDIDGGRFSVMFDGGAVVGDRMTAERSESLVEVLNELLTGAADPQRVESTLRCTEVYETGAVDTLFTPVAGRIEILSRSRVLEEEDHRHAPRELSAALPLPRMGRRQALGLLGLVLVAFGLLAWKEGLVDRIAAHGADKLAVDVGPFADTLAVETVSKWGDYRVTLRRGEGWPVDATAAQVLIDAAQGVQEGAAMRAVAAGGFVFIQLQAEDGRVLDAARVSLARLMASDEGGQAPSVVVTLGGRIAARRLVLALDSGGERR
jgi:hypothetical protein